MTLRFRDARACPTLLIAAGIGLVIALAPATGLAALPEAESPQPGASLAWQAGPLAAAIGNLAEIDLSSAFVFLDAAGTRQFLELTENPVSGNELAVVMPTSETADWFLLFEFHDIGYVPDEEQDDLDAKAMIDSIRAGTEASNEERRRRGWQEMSILGWQEEPHYDSRTNNLSWAVIGESGGYQNINRIVKLLGRSGVMTVTLVASPDELALAMDETDELLSGFRYQPGSTYAEYIPGQDKLAEYGLTALVVGGAGAALVKSGLLARLWKPIALGLVALGAGIKRIFFSGRSADHDPEKPIT